MYFLQLITEEWGLQSGSAFSYMKAIGDLLDYRKASGVSDHSLRAFTVTEVYIRRGKENLAKKKQEGRHPLSLEEVTCLFCYVQVYLT